MPDNLRITEIIRHIGCCPRRWDRLREDEDKKASRAMPPKKDWRNRYDTNCLIAVLAIAHASPMYGYKRVAVIARREGWNLSNRQVFRISKKKGLLRKPVNRDAKLHQTQKLFELLPDGPNQLWQTDVTYVHIPEHGWWYAVTVIDYYSRYLLACHFTPSYSAADCCEALNLAKGRAEMIHGSIPGRINLVTDNGSSFLARRFKSMLREQGFDHYRIQYRTPQQLGLLERFHQNLKREEIYWNLYPNPAEARVSLEKYRHKYNSYRPHWSLKPKSGGDEVTPERVYRSEVEIVIPKWQGWAREAKSKLDGQLTQMDQATG